MQEKSGFHQRKLGISYLDRNKCRFFCLFVSEWFPCMESVGWCCFRWVQQCQGHWWWKFCTVFPHHLENSTHTHTHTPPPKSLPSSEQNFSARWTWSFACSVEQDTQIQFWEGNSWGGQVQTLWIKCVCMKLMRLLRCLIKLKGAGKNKKKCMQRLFFRSDFWYLSLR